MFHCDKCGRQSEPGEKQNKVILQTRERVYRTAEYPGGPTHTSYGTEIVKEGKYGTCCFEEVV